LGQVRSRHGVKTIGCQGRRRLLPAQRLLMQRSGRIGKDQA
jgi:hypothetical protein